MGGESVQLSQAQKRRMEAMSMNMGTRIVCGYLASLLFLGISLYLAVTYHTSGDLQSFWCYLALAAICLTLDVLANGLNKRLSPQTKALKRSWRWWRNRPPLPAS